MESSPQRKPKVSAPRQATPKIGKIMGSEAHKAAGRARKNKDALHE